MWFIIESVDGCSVVILTGMQYCRRPLGIVGRIGKVLWLEADGTSERDRSIVLAFEGAVKEIAGVHLQSGLVGEESERYARSRVGNFGPLY